MRTLRDRGGDGVFTAAKVAVVDVSCAEEGEYGRRGGTRRNRMERVAMESLRRPRLRLLMSSVRKRATMGGEEERGEIGGRE